MSIAEFHIQPDDSGWLLTVCEDGEELGGRLYDPEHYAIDAPHLKRRERRELASRAAWNAAYGDGVIFLRTGWIS